MSILVICGGILIGSFVGYLLLAGTSIGLARSKFKKR